MKNFFNIKNILKYNFNYDFYYNDFSYFKYTRFKKKIFIKNNNKKKINFKNISSLRDKNINLIKKYYNVSNYNGKKESFFNNFNSFLKLFFFIFIRKNSFYSMKENYFFFYENLNSKFINYNFYFFIKDILYESNSIFDIKINKVSKKYQSKIKKKFIFELVYINKNKRIRQTLKLINNNIKNNKMLDLKNNMLSSFYEVLSHPKNSFLWKRKISIYNKAMKKFFKKNLS